MTNPWKKATPEELGAIKGVCLDIDETLSTKGKLTAGAFSALWNLKNAGFCVIPITGRPAGWCDQIARFWPVDAVVGENGAFTFFMKDGLRKRTDTPGGKKGIQKLEKAILAKFPHARWASDQAYREFDLAIDICEDVKPWPQKDIDALLELCAREGAHAKLSSIHVNAWFGHYDKKSGFSHFLNSGELKLPKDLNHWIFIGDSPNDEPMFSFFKNSVGVANIGKYLDRLKHPPRWITKDESGAGFVEMAERLIACRSV